MDYIKDIIENDAIVDISDVLYTLNEDTEEYMNLFGETVEFMKHVNSDSDMVNHILSSWDLEENDANNTFIFALKSFVCTSEELKFLVERSTRLSTLVFMITSIANLDSFCQLINVLSYAYKDSLSKSDLLLLQEHLNSYDETLQRNFSVAYAFIEDQLKTKIDKPSWVNIKDGENISLLQNTSVGLDGNEFNKIMEKMKNMPNNFDVNEDAFNAFAASISDTIDLDQSFTNSFRVWGPENRFTDRECIGNPDTKGGCRMLLCTCHEEEYKRGHEAWFTNECDECKNVIGDISYAVRYPIRNGGWRGCYCGFQCMIDSPPVETETQDDSRLMGVVDKIKEIGIMDRKL